MQTPSTPMQADTGSNSSSNANAGSPSGQGAKPQERSGAAGSTLSGDAATSEAQARGISAQAGDRPAGGQTLADAEAGAHSLGNFSASHMAYDACGA